MAEEGQTQTQTQTQEPHWTESRADWTPEMKTNFSKYKTADDALVAGYEAQRKLGSAIFLPTDKDKPEEKEAKMKDIYLKLGASDKIEDYKSLVKLPEGMPSDEERMKAFTDMAVKYGIPKNVFEELVKQDIKDQLRAMEAFQKQTEKEKADAAAAEKAKTEKDAVEAVLKIREKYKLTETEYNETMELNNRFIQSYGDTDLWDLLNKSGVGNHVGFFKLYSDMAKFYLSEDKPTVLSGLFSKAREKVNPENDAFTLRRDK